jgi:hypothetical protein
MARYRARYNETGKIYEEIDDVVVLDNRQQEHKASYFVMDDIQPYQSMQTGEMITSRSQHRNHLKQHGLIELGNEKIKETKPIPYNSEEVKREIARQLYR